MPHMSEFVPEKPFIKGGYLDIKEAELHAAIDTVNKGKERPNQLTDLADQTKEARKALQEALAGIGDAVETFGPKSDEYIRTLRQFTASGVLEIRNLMKAFEDVRKFFLSADHDKELARLREFIELCERLRSLKQDGFLDAISDTILKLDLE